MNPPGRRMLFAALATTLLVPAAPSYAACVVDVDVCAFVGELTDLGGGGGGGDADGTLCKYVKQSSPPPSDWTGNDAGGPYFFWRTQAWGDSPEHRRFVDWDKRGCIPACEVASFEVAKECAPRVDA